LSIYRQVRIGVRTLLDFFAHEVYGQDRLFPFRLGNTEWGEENSPTGKQLSSLNDEVSDYPTLIVNKNIVQVPDLPILG
jgi:hypothetical protein